MIIYIFTTKNNQTSHSFFFTFNFPPRKISIKSVKEKINIQKTKKDFFKKKIDRQTEVSRQY
jgi:hypothetical protein